MGYEITAPWAKPAGTVAVSSGGSAAAKPTLVPDSVEEMKSKMHQAAKLGFMVDAYIAPKQQTETQTYKIIAVSETDLEVNLIEAGSVKGEKLTITWDKVFADWRLHKGKVTAKMTGWSHEQKCSPLHSKLWLFEGAKGAITMALIAEYASKEHLVDGLEMLQHPTSVRANRDFKAGELQLIPASQRIERKQGDKGVPVGRFALSGEDKTQLTPLFVMPQFVPPTNAQGEANKTPWVAPFWAVVGAADANDSNMDLGYIKHELNGYTVYVPVLKNTKKLTAGDELKWNKKAVSEPWKAKAKAASGAANKKTRVD